MDLLGPLTWRITQVPYGLLAEVLMQAVCNGCPDGEQLLSINVPPSTCMNTDLVVAWDVEASGATCLRFTWTPQPSVFTRGYYYELQLNGTRVHSGTATPTDAELVFDDVLPETPYVLLLTGLCSGLGSTGNTTATPAVTMPQAYLGPEYVIVSTTPTPGAEDITATLVFSYSNYYCAVGFVTPEYVNADPDWEGPINEVSDAPMTWEVPNVPWESTPVFLLQASSNVDCVCQSPDSVALVRTISVAMPSPPSDICSEITGLTWNADTSGATCLSFSWTPEKAFTQGYVYLLQQGTTHIENGSLPNWNTATITIASLSANFTADTAYTFTLRGQCGPTSFSDPVSVDAHTTPACTPTLPVFTQTTTNPVFVSNGDGTYDAILTYTGFTCVTQPILQWLASTGSTTPVVPVNTITWQILNLPADTTTNHLQFTAAPLFGTSCTSCCAVSTPEVLNAPVIFTTPGKNQQCANQGLTVQAVPPSGSTCLAFSWTPGAGANFTGYNWRIYKGTLGPSSIPVQKGTLSSSVSQLTITGLDANTAYTFQIQGVCAASKFTTYRTATASTKPFSEPALAPFTQTSSNTTFSWTSGSTVLVTMTLAYSLSECTCISGLSLAWKVDTEPDGSTITQSGSKWIVTNVPAVGTSYFVFTGTPTSGTCTNGCGPTSGPITLEFPINVVDPPIPTVAPPFTLTITHYAGPPVRLQSAGKSLSNSTLDPDPPNILYGAGGTGQAGSWYNQQSLNQYYATNVVENFVKYNMQQPFTIQNETFFLAIDAIYYGNAIDPTVQGASVIHPNSDDTGYEVDLIYNYADSTSTINGAGRESFQYPPYIEFYQQMMIYNWEMYKNVHKNNRMVQLASNNYGSNKATENWWFNCSITELGIGTIAPTNGKTLNSLVDNRPNDGNYDTGKGYAGWNCMERWFMHAAYVNQQLRRIIESGAIVGTGAAGTAMTLNDLNQDNAKFFQISAITTDSEGNGFENTLYKGEDDHTAAQCNLTMKILWDKWINQSIAFPAGTTPPDWWYNDPSNPDYKQLLAPHPRVVMPTTSFTLPCAMSMTSPGLIKDMKTNDVGSPDYDAINAVFVEVYDTSDRGPYYFLGADPVAITDCSVPRGSIHGYPFTATVQKAANPTLPTDAYVANPASYQNVYGGWDNLVPTGATCTGGLNIVDNALVNDPALSGTYTVLNNGFGDADTGQDNSNAFSPLINTSEFTPWSHGSNPWIVVKDNPHGLTPNPDAVSLGWALEASRYDLYNGKWAAAACAGTGIINYDAVLQGHTYTTLSGETVVIDGATVWNDLSTGLKVKVAQSLAQSTINNVAAAAGQIWMLSNQAGQFTNCKGVRSTVRVSGNITPITDSNYFLPFTCPDSALNGEAWPGWTGMQNQWWGPGTSATAGVLQRYALDQAWLGPYDPAGSTPATITNTGAGEDNWGVFHDFNIQLAGWYQMAQDLRGKGLNPNGISNTAIKYTDDPTGTGPPKLGCYELGFMPLSWMSPVPQPPTPPPPPPPS